MALGGLAGILRRYSTGELFQTAGYKEAIAQFRAANPDLADVKTPDQLSEPERNFNISLAFGSKATSLPGKVSGGAQFTQGVGSNTGLSAAGEAAKVSSIQAQANEAIARAGTAVAGTNKHARTADVEASRVINSLNSTGFFAERPSTGGFTVLGKNALGVDIVRDNTNNTIRTGASDGGKVGLATPVAKTLGKTKTPQVLAKQGNSRRKDRGERATTVRQQGVTAKKTQKSILGTQDILGAQSILG
jgi:hypothetical protein